MNTEDADIMNAERDANPERFHDYDPNNSFEREYAPIEAARTTRTHVTQTSTQNGATEEAERAGSVSSSSTGSSIRTGARTQSHRPSVATRASTRLETEFMHYLDRHPTAVKRIQDHRLQHSQTVGSTKYATGDGTPLPTFGGGKPYPPPLPDREEYVVEFDGHEDLRHAQNWPLKTKLIISGILIFDALAATFASSILSAANTFVSRSDSESTECLD